MTETKWTPGPWKIERWSGFDYGSYQYSIPGVATNIGIKANAHLIAATPDLYAATDFALMFETSLKDLRDDADVKIILKGKEIRALIDARRKARGE